MGNGMGSGPLKDTSLEAAQKEFQRRLLRGQKLQRIEREEMRGLAAMGWKPPVEGAAGSGSSIHDAADAIEEAEGRRRAYAQEARRRAEESEAPERASLWHDVNLNPNATPMASANIDITYSDNLDTKRVGNGVTDSLQANWYGGGSFTVGMTVAHISARTADMPMQVRISGSFDGKKFDRLSMDIARQVVHMEGVIKRVKFPVDDDHGKAHTLRLQVDNESGFDVEAGLEVNGIRQIPLRPPVEGPFVP